MQMNFIIVLLFSVVPVHTCTAIFGTEEDQAIFFRDGEINKIIYASSRFRRTVSGNKLSYSTGYLSPTAKRHACASALM